MAAQLCTPLDLHSSQTASSEARRISGFVPLWIYTALKPHREALLRHVGLCTPLDLHSSQTIDDKAQADDPALYPSGFTQLSNLTQLPQRRFPALYPSGFTQLSNLPPFVDQRAEALYPSGFTQLSNLHEFGCRCAECFVPLWIYTALKQKLLEHRLGLGFVPLWIYTALKRRERHERVCFALYPSGFTQLSNFDYVRYARDRLCTPLDLHSSQTRCARAARSPGFVPLWIYTALKPQIRETGPASRRASGGKPRTFLL